MSVIKAIFLPISHELSIDLELEVEISASSLEIIAVHPKSTSTDAQKTSLNVPAECPKCYENISLNVSLFRREHEPVTIKEEKVFLKEEEETEVEEFTDCEYYVDYYEQSPEKAPKKTPKTTLKTSRKRKPTRAKRLPSPIEEVDAPPKPEKICKNCGQNFQTRTKWENHERSCIIDIQCFECSKVFKNKTLYSNHVKAEHDGVWRCHICHVQMDRQRAWLHHMQRGDHDVGKEMVECERCNGVFTQIEFSIHKTDLLKEDVLCQLCHDGKKFHTKTEFKEHVQELHDNDKFACSVCYPVEIMPNLAKFLIHMRYHWNSVKPRCGNCKKNFNSLAERDTHILKCIIENPVVEYECDICTNKYRTKEALKRHVLDYHKHNGKIYQCHECGTTFYRKRSYDTHLLQHEFADRRPFKCDFCKRGFTNKQSMRNHILFIHYPKDLCTVPCDVEGCKEMCYSQEHLTKHRKTHKAKESRVCDVCGKVLSDKHTLLTHLKLVHTVKGSNKKHECDQCNFTTNNAKYLKIHKMQHLPNDKKPFQCKFCGKGFINRSIGIRHEMIHTDARPIVCTTCGKRFRHQGDLKTHMRLHTGDKPYECSVCGKKYGDRGCFRTHLVMHERQLNITLDKSIKKPMLIAGETTQ